MFGYPLGYVAHVEVDVTRVHAMSEAFYNLLCVFGMLARYVQRVYDGATSLFP